MGKRVALAAASSNGKRATANVNRNQPNVIGYSSAMFYEHIRKNAYEEKRPHTFRYSMAKAQLWGSYRRRGTAAIMLFALRPEHAVRGCSKE